MLDNADLIEQYEIRIQSILDSMHRDGIRYEVIHGIMKEHTEILEIQDWCEKRLMDKEISHGL